MTSHDPALDEALERVVDRVRRTAAELTDDAFPHWADPQTGAWRTTYTGDWTNGAWPGLLWLASRAADDPALARAASEWSGRLAPRAEADTAFKGFTFYYGAALGALVADDEAAGRLGTRTAVHLAGMYDERLGLIPLGKEAQEHSDVGATDSSIDSLQATPLLLWAARADGGDRLREVALAHTRRVLANHVRPDGSIVQSSSLDPETGRVVRTFTHKGFSDDSTWARAQAWGILYTAMSALECPEEVDLLEQARRAADWWLANVPADGVSYWDFDDPAIPDTALDTAATGIVAAGLLKLALREPDADRAERYRGAAERAVGSLASDHLTPLGPGETRPAGMLVHGCFTKRPDARPQDAVTDAELIFGDYYLLECLMVLTGRLEAGDV